MKGELFTCRVYRKLISTCRWSERPLLEEALRIIKCNSPGVYIIKLPTGYGKTGLVFAHAFSSLVGECSFSTVYASPLRSLADDVYNRWIGIASKIIGVSTEQVSGLQHMGVSGSVYLNKPIVFTTLDTLSLHVFKNPPAEIKKTLKGERGHYEVSRGALADATIFLDEPHLAMSDEAMLKALLALISFLEYIGSTVVLITATLPRKLEDIVTRSIKYLRGRLSYGEGSFVDKEFEEQQASKLIVTKVYSKFLTSIANEKVRKMKGGRTIIVFNSRKRAVEAYSSIRKSSDEVYLLHGFMIRKEREIVEECLRKRTRKRKDFVLIATQVIEAGFDISAEWLLTEAASASSLVQRAGRVARWKGDYRGLVEIYLPPSPKPYNNEEVIRALELIKRYKVSWRNAVITNGALSYIDFIEKASVIPEISMGEVQYLRRMIKDPLRGWVTLFKKVVEGKLLRSSRIIPVYVEGRIEDGEALADFFILKSMLKEGGIIGYVAKEEERIGPHHARDATGVVETLLKNPLEGFVLMLRKKVDGILIEERTYCRWAYGEQ